MENESPYEYSICYVYIGQRTGEYGLLKEDFEYYQKNFLHVNTFSTLKDNLGLIQENTRPGVQVWKMRAKDKIFLQTTKQGEQKALEILNRRMGAPTRLKKRLKKIPEDMLIFLIKHELLRLDGVYPEDPTDPPSTYIGEEMDNKRDLFNCLFHRFENERLNRELLEKRQELFWTLIDMKLCVTASAYYLAGGTLIKHVGVETTSTHGTYGNKLNYCLPPNVLTFIHNLFEAETKKFEFPMDLQKKHCAYHQIRESKAHLFNLSSDGAGSWLEGPMENTVLSPIGNPETSQILNNMLARKILSLSSLETLHEGKKWRAVNIADLCSKEGFRFLEEQCLQPILDFLTARSGNSAERKEGSSRAETIDRIVDASNIAHYTQEQYPRFHSIALCIEYYKKKNLRIKIIADANLERKIDEKISFQKALDDRLISQSPLGREADEFILWLAHLYPESNIVSNDNFLDWAKKFGFWGDLRIIREVFAKPERFIKFKINGAFIELPFGQRFQEKSG